MLDRICPGIDGGLYADLVRGVDRDLDHIDVLKRVPPHRLPRLICPVDQQKFLLEDSVSKSGIQILDVRASGDEFASGSQNPGAGNAAGIDRVTQFGVSVDARVTEVADRGEAALQVFAS